MSACVCLVGNREWTAELNRVREQLVAEGIATTDDLDSSGHLVAVIFEESPNAFTTWRASSGGPTRVLIVARDATDAHGWLICGAEDVVRWNDGSDTVGGIVARVRRWLEVEELVRAPLVRDNLVGQSPVWLGVLRDAIEVARWSKSSVLITGESGTGKELVARLIHTLDPRANKGNLVVVDCTTIVPELSGSEFFGHERGAFTGAVSSRDGAFALADRGTLFLDEVGELAPRLQAELLRVIQERTYKRVGSNTWRQTDFRLVCATNRDLPHEVQCGRFRADLFHRLSAWNCRLPSLAERAEDVPLLVVHALKAALETREPPELDPAVVHALTGRSYPGNVRELRQLVSRIAARYVPPGPITIGAIPPADRPPATAPRCAYVTRLESAVRIAIAEGVTLDELCSQTQRAAFDAVLSTEGENTARAADRLGCSQRTVQLYRKNARATGEPAPSHVQYGS